MKLILRGKIINTLLLSGFFITFININAQTPHSSDKILDTKLKFNPFGDSFTANDCQGSYTVYKPVSEKVMTSRYWSSNNTQNIFDANVYINANWTYMQRQCASGTLFGVPYCICTGPFVWSGQNTTLANQHNTRPTTTQNYDDPPASNLGAQLELYEGSAYPFYNSWFAGNAYANHDGKPHVFSPIISTHDIRNPNTGLPVSNFTSLDNASGGLNLLNVQKDNLGLLVEETDKRFGFPHLSYPTNHYQVTPFDGVYGIGINNAIASSCSGNVPFAKPDNQFHNEDPQKFIGDYLARVEVAPTDLFLTNRTIGANAVINNVFLGNYIAEFEARNKIIVGRTKIDGVTNIYNQYGNTNFLQANNDFKVAPTCKLILHSGDFVEMLPGFEVPLGAELDAYIQAYNCADLLFRVNNNQSTNNNNPKHNLPNLGFNYDEPINKNPNKKLNSFLLYPNPNNGNFTYVNVCDGEPNSLLIITNIEGKIVYQCTIYNNSPVDLNLNQLTNGLYLVKVINKSSSDNFKLNIVH